MSYIQQILNTKDPEYPLECPNCDITLLCYHTHGSYGMTPVLKCECCDYNKIIQTAKDFIRYMALCSIQLSTLYTNILNQ